MPPLRHPNHRPARVPRPSSAAGACTASRRNLRWVFGVAGRPARYGDPHNGHRQQPGVEHPRRAHSHAANVANWLRPPWPARTHAQTPTPGEPGVAWAYPPQPAARPHGRSEPGRTVRRRRAPARDVRLRPWSRSRCRVRSQPVSRSRTNRAGQPARTRPSQPVMRGRARPLAPADAGVDADADVDVDARRRVTTSAPPPPRPETADTAPHATDHDHTDIQTRTDHAQHSS